MSTRRDFLFSTLVITAMPGLARGAKAYDDATVRVVTESGCSDTRSFAQAFGAKATLSGADPADFLFHLDDEMARGGVDVICGLTRSSTQFLIEQTAASHNHRLVYRGEHRYTPAGLQHSLCGSSGSLDPLVRRLKSNPGAWARELARAIRLLDGTGGMTATREALIAVKAPRDSSRHLVSWLLRRD